MAAPQAALDLDLIQYLQLKLAALGQPSARSPSDARFLQIARPLLRNHYEKERLLGSHLCPVDSRIQSFLEAYLADCCRRNWRPAPACEHLRSRSPRSGSRHVAPTGFEQLFVSLSALLSRPTGRAPQSFKRPPDHPGRLPHRRGRLPDSRRQASRAKAHLRRTAGGGASSSTRRAHHPLHRGPTGACSLIRFAAPAPARLPGHRRRPASAPWRLASSRPAAWSAISISSNQSSAMPAIRTCPKTTPLSTSRTGPATPAA